MRAKIIKIGNSQGIRIPKLFLEQAGLANEVEIEAQDNQIIIRSAFPRQGWEEAFRSMNENRDDELLDAEPYQTDWEQKDWQW